MAEVSGIGGVFFRVGPKRQEVLSRGSYETGKTGLLLLSPLSDADSNLCPTEADLKSEAARPK